MYTLSTSSTARILDHDALYKAAPSIFAEEPWGEVSDRYAFVPTIRVVDYLATEGYLPVRASQSMTKTEDRGAYARHLVRFRHRDHLQVNAVGTDFPEVIVTNSHDRSCLLEFMAGIFRLWCSNGAVCPVGKTSGFRVRHLGTADFLDRVTEATFGAIEQTHVAMAKLAEWRDITLDRDEREGYAMAALEVKGSALEIAPTEILQTRRKADASNDLWTVTNVVQEHLMRGGAQGRDARGRTRRIRAIGSVTEDVRINKELWQLSDRMATYKLN
jgi:hypothetical protein